MPSRLGPAVPTTASTSPTPPEAAPATVTTPRIASVSSTTFDATPVLRPGAPSLTAEVDPTRITWARVERGQLFVDGLSWDDVTQGAVGNCYLLSALSAVAATSPEVLTERIRHVGGGVYEVRFFEKTRTGPREIAVRVDGTLPLEDGERVYGGAREARELWVSLVEKAFAAWQGGYEVINQGGFPEDTFYALTGRKSDYVGDLQRARASRVWSLMEAATKDGRPMTAGTWLQADFEADYEAVGLVEGHAYSLLGVSDVGGERTVTLRNPWGTTEFGADGRDDGVFTMSFDAFRRYFGDLTIVRADAAA